jgi:hypothetical protein
MRRLILGLACAIALGAPATASAITAAQAQRAVSAKLARVYGVAWTLPTPSWSRPECRAPDRPQHFTCPTEFEHAGVWRRVIATVSGRTVKLLRSFAKDHWQRRWSVSGPDCTTQGSTTVVGELSSNDGGCYELTLWQNFGDGGTGRVRYTGFKPSVFIYGTGTAVWPDFYLFKCKSYNKTYQCTNRFGDGFRWKPEAASTPAPTTEFYARSAVGTIGCGLGPAGQLVCLAFPSTAGALTQVAKLQPDGTVQSCTQKPGESGCFAGDFGEGTPTLAAGQELTIGPYRCAVSDGAVQCTVAASGKGFVITTQQITPVAGAAVSASG